MRKPDFERLRKTLFCEKADFVPLAELFHDLEIMDGFMGGDVNTTQDIIAFYERAGYDYIPVGSGSWFSGVKTQEEETLIYARSRESRKKRASFSYSEAEKLLIDDLNGFRNYDWSRHGWLRGGGEMDYLDYVAGLMPERMKIIAWSDGIYEFFTKSVGYEKFCYALADDIAFVEEVFHEVGSRAVRAYERVLAHPQVGAVWLADDIGYTEGLLWSPELMRKYLFPWYKEIGKLAKQKQKPFIFHSDGRLWDVLPDLIDAGINAIQPIEPKAWDPAEIRRSYPSLCVMGTIDLDLLCRGTVEEVIELTKKHIDLFRGQGGFAVGTSNTPTFYMNIENYRAMVQTALTYG